MKTENDSNGRGLETGAKPIKYENLLTEEKREQVISAVRRKQAAQAEKLSKASSALSSAMYDEMARLSKEPLTTGALFLVTGLLVEFASEVLRLAKKPDYDSSDDNPCENLDDWFEISASPAIRMLLEQHLSGARSPYWDALEAKDDARSEYRINKERLLDETANEMFGQPAKEAK